MFMSLPLQMTRPVQAFHTSKTRRRGDGSKQLSKLAGLQRKSRRGCKSQGKDRGKDRCKGWGRAKRPDGVQSYRGGCVTGFVDCRKPVFGFDKISNHESYA